MRSKGGAKAAPQDWMVDRFLPEVGVPFWWCDLGLMAWPWIGLPAPGLGFIICKWKSSTPVIGLILCAPAGGLWSWQLAWNPLIPHGHSSSYRLPCHCCLGCDHPETGLGEGILGPRAFQVQWGGVCRAARCRFSGRRLRCPCRLCRVSAAARPGDLG